MGQNGEAVLALSDKWTKRDNKRLSYRISLSTHLIFCFHANKVLGQVKHAVGVICRLRKIETRTAGMMLRSFFRGMDNQILSAY